MFRYMCRDRRKMQSGHKEPAIKDAFCCGSHWHIKDDSNDVITKLRTDLITVKERNPQKKFRPGQERGVEGRYAMIVAVNEDSLRKSFGSRFVL